MKFATFIKMRPSQNSMKELKSPKEVIPEIKPPQKFE